MILIVFFIRFSEIEIYHLNRLQYLNVSHNYLQSFQDMRQLNSLRSLDASHNSIESCTPFLSMTSLIQLSLRSNSIRDLAGFHHHSNQLESLDLSFNRIESIDASSFHAFAQLIELNLSHNNIKRICLDQPLHRLCSLRLSFNRLKSFDVSLFPEVRILFLDDNQIQRIIGVTCISRLDSFSLRDQGREKV